MKRLLPLLLAFVFAAQVSYCGGWGRVKIKLIGNFNLTQASFSNWTQGGENMLGWQSGIDGDFTLEKGASEIANKIKLNYGMSKIGDAEARKSVDEINIGSVYTYRAGLFVDPYIAINALTQFTKGYDYSQSTRVAISDFMDPVYFSESVGIGKRYGEILRSRLGFALKQTLTHKYPSYSDDPSTPKAEKSRFEAGAQFVTELSLKLTQKILLSSSLVAFSNLKATREIDVTWDTTLSAEVEKYVSVNLGVKVLYDRDLSAKRQVKQGLSIGLTYAFI